MTKDAPSRASGFVYPRPDPGAKLRLFCFPYAGAGAAIYYSWANGSLDNVEVCAVELPGRGTRMQEPALTSIQSQVDSVFGGIHKHLDKPFAFWGHSMGSIIAFELTRRLSLESNLAPAHLFVSGRQAPHIPDKFAPTYNLPEPDLLRDLKRLNGTPREVLESPELMQLVLPMLRADLEAIDTYSYKPGAKIGCPITVFGGVRDPEVDRAGLEGWSEHTTAAFSLRMLPGDHFFLHSAQQLLLKIVNQGLQRVMQSL
ncbi:MAG TPA: alpha/beta fold hydrolase [Blastocatellia bacterium]|nr:alpha/beta fold hydrolase [Blastocatellia bacterium]